MLGRDVLQSTFGGASVTPGLHRRLATFLCIHPRWAILIVSVGAVVLSVYPVVFGGRSFVSPDAGTTLLYSEFPTLPGYHTESMLDSRGSDVGAILWQHVAYSSVQRSALLAGELPLRNRYNSLGNPLLGQGQSMFGDPLHFIPVVTGGATWSWDLKFITAKIFFSVGVAYVVFDTTGSLLAALAVSVGAPFVGFFVFRISHPAIFSLCYSPWIVWMWLGISGAGSIRIAATWLTGLVVANWCVMNSGTVKEASILLFWLNLTGCCVLLSSAQGFVQRLLKLAGAVWAGVSSRWTKPWAEE